MKWLLVDPDEEFSNKFVNKVQELIDIDYFANSKIVSQKDLDKYDKVIIADKVKSKVLRNFKKIIILTENLEKDGDNYVYKFQPYKEIIERIEFNQIEDEKKVENNYNKIILLYFLTSKLDKIQMVTRTLNKLGKESKTFYLNLESISNVDDYVDYDKKYPSIINAFYNKDYRDIIFKSSNNVHMFYPTDNAMEIINVGFEKIGDLVKTLVGDGYNYVFLDIDSKFDLSTMKYFELADEILIFTDNITTKYERLINTLKSISDDENMINKICKIKIDKLGEKVYEKIKEELKKK